MLLRLTTVPLLFALSFAACTSVDAERRQMESAITSADRLGHEISSWRTTLPADVPLSLADSIEAFQVRANETEGVLDGLTSQASAGVDLIGLKQALTAVAEFDMSNFAAASPSARRAILDQFAGLATNLQKTAERARARV